jgi:hypothetical protein
MTTTVMGVSKNLFSDDETIFEPVQKSSLQKLKEKKDFTNLLLDDTFSADVVRSALKYARNVLTSLTLDGSWDDEEFRTFTPYMNQVTSLHLVNTTFTNEAFNEAFISKVCHEYPFQEPLEVKEDLDAWDAEPYIPPKRPPNFTNLSTGETLSINVNCTRLSELTIENPRGVTEGFLSKLLPLKDQLTSLTLIGCPGTIKAEEVLSDFPKLQTIVIK